MLRFTLVIIIWILGLNKKKRVLVVEIVTKVK